VTRYRNLTWSIVLTIVGFGVWAALEDHERILHSILRIGWQGFMFLCAFSLVNYFCRYLRWILLLRHFGDRFSFVDGLLCYLAAFALTTTPGKVGEAIRSLFFFRRHQIPHSHSLAALLAERLGDALAGLILSTLAIYTFADVRWLGVLFTALIVLAVFLVQRPGMLLHMSKWLSAVKIRSMQNLPDQIAAFLARAREVMTIPKLSMVTLIGLASWSAEAFAFAWLSLQLGGSASVLLYMSIFAIAMVAGAATFLPGGLGSTEAVMFLLLQLTGMGDAEAFTVALLSRLATLWLAVILGVVSMLWLDSHPRGGALLELDRERP
jgi:uncharacterized protein (TIRG00374 family)